MRFVHSAGLRCTIFYLNGLIHAWCYVAAQMIQSVSDFDVTFLAHIISVELRPARILQYLMEYVGKRASVALYFFTAVVPRAKTNSQLNVWSLFSLFSYPAKCLSTIG